jgi:transposase
VLHLILETALLPELDGMTKLLSDKAYYQKERNEALLAKWVTPVIQPKSDAIVNGDGSWHDKIVEYIQRKGMYAFQNKYGHGARSLVEAQFSRIKRCIGESLKTRRDSSQKQEGKTIANLINLWNTFGKSECVKTA